MELVSEIYQMIEDVSEILGRKLIRDKEFKIVDRGCPHEPPTELPKGYAAVYSFIYKGNGKFLKIGKANEKSETRFVYQHYSVNAASSTLAKSICNDKDRKLSNENIKEWILNNTRRIDVLIKCDNSEWATTLIEAIMHYKYMPQYEG